MNIFLSSSKVVSTFPFIMLHRAVIPLVVHSLNLASNLFGIKSESYGHRLRNTIFPYNLYYYSFPYFKSTICQWVINSIYMKSHIMVGHHDRG